MNTGPLIALCLISLILLGGAIKAAFGYWTVRRDAPEEWKAFRVTRRAIDANISEQQFIAAYRRTHSPRGLAFGTMALGLAVLVTPLAVMALTFIYANFIVQPSDADLPAAKSAFEEARRHFRRDGPLVYSFFLFFGLIASWGAVAYAVAGFYYRNNGLGLDAELGLSPEPVERATRKLRRKRPNWSPLVRTEAGLALSKDKNKQGSEPKETD